MIGAAETIREHVKGGREAIEYWEEFVDLSDKTDILLDSYHETLINQNIYTGMHEQVFVEINLHATDDDLKNAFGEWLSNKRERKSDHLPTPRKESYTQRDLNEWIQKRVLPYIDLKILAEYYNVNLTLTAAGRILFPDEYYVDLGERIRKTVKPLAEELLKDSSMYALFVAAGNYEKKYRNK